MTDLTHEQPFSVSGSSAFAPSQGSFAPVSFNGPFKALKLALDEWVDRIRLLHLQAQVDTDYTLDTPARRYTLKQLEAQAGTTGFGPRYQGLKVQVRQAQAEARVARQVFEQRLHAHLTGYLASVGTLAPDRLGASLVNVRLTMEHLDQYEVDHYVKVMLDDALEQGRFRPQDADWLEEECRRQVCEQALQEGVPLDAFDPATDADDAQIAHGVLASLLSPPDATDVSRFQQELLRCEDPNVPTAAQGLGALTAAMRRATQASTSAVDRHVREAVEYAFELFDETQDKVGTPGFGESYTELINAIQYAHSEAGRVVRSARVDALTRLG